MLAALTLVAGGPQAGGSARAAEIAYLAAGGGDRALVVAGEDGRDPRTLGWDLSWRYFQGGPLALSADGRTVAYCLFLQESGAPNGYRRYVVVEDVNDGDGLLVTSEGDCSSLDFSPDGARLLYGEFSETTGTDIWEIELAEPQLRQELITWDGTQMDAKYTADGDHIVFSSNADAEGEPFGEEPPYEWHLFKALANGASPVNITAGSSLWTEKGAEYALAPDPRINDDTVVFECGIPEGKWTVLHLCRIDIDGTNGMDLGIGGGEPSWNPYGTKILYTRPSFPETGMEASPTGESPTEINLEPVEGFSAYSALSVVPRQSESGLDHLARTFQPNVRLDEGERWQPLDLEVMVDELPPRICIAECEFLWELDELGEVSGATSPGAVMDIPPVGGDWDTEPHVDDADDYGADDCSEWEEPAEECEDLEHSAVYYDYTRVSPGGYRYLQYWSFYRFNDSPLDTVPVTGERLDHEADWEQVSIGIPDEAPPGTFDFVVLSQHGDQYAYLRENLSCEGETCGPQAKAVDVFPAAGTHATYASACTDTLLLGPCKQQNGNPETDHGGEDGWIGNGDAGALRRFPEAFAGTWLEGPRDFTDWTGEWGYDIDLASHVASPANQSSFAEPWVADCDGGDPECDREEEGELLRSFAVGSPSGSWEEIVPGECERWFGADVSAAFCAPRRLEDSLEEAAIGKREGTVALRSLRGGKRTDAATTGGLAQLAGRPLGFGGRLALLGEAKPGALLLVRARAGNRLTEAAFRLDSPEQSVIVMVERQAARGRPVAIPVARTGAGDQLEPAALRVLEPKFDLRGP